MENYSEERLKYLALEMTDSDTIHWAVSGRLGLAEAVQPASPR